MNRRSTDLHPDPSVKEHTYELPPLAGRRWGRVVDTMQVLPHDMAGPVNEAALADQPPYRVGARSQIMPIGRWRAPLHAGLSSPQPKAEPSYRKALNCTFRPGALEKPRVTPARLHPL
jgi:hypothetical protein